MSQTKGVQWCKEKGAGRGHGRCKKGRLDVKKRLDAKRPLGGHETFRSLDYLAGRLLLMRLAESLGLFHYSLARRGYNRAKCARPIAVFPPPDCPPNRLQALKVCLSCSRYPSSSHVCRLVCLCLSTAFSVR